MGWFNIVSDIFSVLTVFRASVSCEVEIDEEPYVRLACPALGGPVRRTSQQSEREKQARPARGGQDTTKRTIIFVSH